MSASPAATTRDATDPPVVNVEVMAAGRPVIGSRVGGIPELVEDGRTGLLVPPEDPASLARAIAALTDDEARRRALATGARARVQTMTWSRIAERMDALYGEIGVPRVAA
jgi:starch synthase